MKVKAKLLPLTYIRMAFIKNQDKTKQNTGSIGRMWEVKRSSALMLGLENGAATRKQHSGWSGIPLLGTHSELLNPGTQTDGHSSITDNRPKGTGDPPSASR